MVSPTQRRKITADSQNQSSTTLGPKLGDDKSSVRGLSLLFFDVDARGALKRGELFFPPWNQVDLIFGKSGQPFY